MYVYNCLVQHNSLAYSDMMHYKEDKSQVDTVKLKALQEAASVFSESLKLELDEDEYYFMVNLL